MKKIINDDYPFLLICKNDNDEIIKLFINYAKRKIRNK